VLELDALRARKATAPTISLGSPSRPRANCYPAPRGHPRRASRPWSGGPPTTAGVNGPRRRSPAFGVVLIFVQIPGGALVYSVLGLVVFAVLTIVDFQRLRRSTDKDSASVMAASIFLDVLNVFLFFLQIFSRD